MKNPKNILIILIGIIFCLFIGVYVLYSNGLLIFNTLNVRNYSVRGVDVSSYQGEIDWNKLASNDIDFAYIKSTEGSSFAEKSFKYNWENANKTDLRIGAYHFLSFESSGQTQAQNFINTVPNEKNNLPPAVDVEFYGKYLINYPSKESVQKILGEFITTTELHYGKKVVIYSTLEAYNLYIKDLYTSNPIWIRNVFLTPQLPDRDWTFWQYTDKAKLEGYKGEEKFIDMNVFNGDEESFKNWN